MNLINNIFGRPQLFLFHMDNLFSHGLGNPFLSNGLTENQRILVTSKVPYFIIRQQLPFQFALLINAVYGQFVRLTVQEQGLVPVASEELSFLGEFQFKRIVNGSRRIQTQLPLVVLSPAMNHVFVEIIRHFIVLLDQEAHFLLGQSIGHA